MTSGEEHGTQDNSRDAKQSRWLLVHVDFGLLKAILLAMLFAIGGCGVVFVWAISKTGSTSAGLAFLRGDSVYAIAGGPIGVDSTARNTAGSTTITFCNLSRKPIRIVGYDNPCSCVKIEGLPLTVAPGKRRQVTAKARLPAQGGQADQPLQSIPIEKNLSLKFLTDIATQSWLWVDIEIRQGNISE